MVEAGRGALYASRYANTYLGVYPHGRPVENAPRGQRGLARLSKAGLTRETGTSCSRSGACEERGKPKATEDRSLDTLRGSQYEASTALCLRGATRTRSTEGRRREDRDERHDGSHTL